MAVVANEDAKFVNRTLRTVFLALLIDILAFTIILPLFPRLLQAYYDADAQNEDSIFYFLLTYIRRFRVYLSQTPDDYHSPRLDIVLFGGALGSIFSFLQFISSPLIGKASDVYGRRQVLLLSMIGNAVSMILWMFSKSFLVFVASRIVGGLTEGNVQMSIAIISDITTKDGRSKGIALVGIAFALGFTVGPPLGAYFTSHVNLFDLVPFLESIPYSNPYSSPALFALVLIVVETIYLYIALPETLYFHASRTHGAGGINSAVSSPGTANDTPDLPYSPPSQQQQQQIGGKKSPTGTALLEKSLSNEVQSSSSTTTFKYSSKPSSTSSSQFNILSILHFMFLFCFSGMEFTLPFLTHDIFDFSPMQQGKLLAFIGVASALVQGGYVRRVAHKTVHEKTLLLQGVASCSIGLVAISLVRPLNDFGDGMGIYALYFGSAFLAFTSGTVVSSLTALASFTTTKAINNNPNTSNLTHPSSSSDSFSDTPTTRTTSSSSNSTATPLAGIEAVGEMTQGHALGKFRSLGQLGRAVGPIAACSAYWVLGSMACYQVGAVLMAVTFVAMWVLISVPKNWKRKVKNQ